MWLCLAGSGRTARQLPATMAGARQDMRTRIPSTGADDGNKFSPWEDFFVNPFGSVLTNYVSVHVCTGAG